MRKTSAYRGLEFECRRQITVENFTTWIVSKEDLNLSKFEWAKASYSEFQFCDVRNLASTGYDAAYVEHWTHKLDLATLWDECRP